MIETALRYPAAPEQADLQAHHTLARRAAAAGTVLLTNRGTLPLGQGSLAVIGAFAHHPRYQGAGSSQVTPTRVDTLLDALREDALREDRSVGLCPRL